MLPVMQIYTDMDLPICIQYHLAGFLKKDLKIGFRMNRFSTRQPPKQIETLELHPATCFESAEGVEESAGVS